MDDLFLLILAITIVAVVLLADMITGYSKRDG